MLIIKKQHGTLKLLTEKTNLQKKTISAKKEQNFFLNFACFFSAIFDQNLCLI